MINRNGHTFRDMKELADWLKSQPPEVVRAINREWSTKLPSILDPNWEYWLSDYKEISPGCWLPMTQSFVNNFVDEDGKPKVSLKREIKFTEAKVNVPLPDAMFTAEFEEGAESTIKRTTHR